jgi:hypothetical protein
MRRSKRNSTAELSRKMQYHCLAPYMRNLRWQSLSQRLQKSIAAIACLIALLLIYAPMAIATVMAVSGACCAGERCPIHGNHHPAQNHGTHQNEATPMDCGHEGHGTSTLNPCSMSCCQTVEQAPISVHAFLLTPLAITTSLATLATARMAVCAFIVSPVFAPQAPPPKRFFS